MAHCLFKVESAVRAAQNAFPEWSTTSPQERSKIMSRLADLIEENLESFAQAESKDQGNSISQFGVVFLTQL